ncbi:hypothetical protein KP79_PYT06030 [Mizuhopecten yessoensis]|uniref:Peroxiredoxin-like 2A n=1 Tax=Mizuhopecten yessoensis TaxID=6573 RepID=A0A210PMX8_MIZYE|nr:hypothetical protein KP79_PYT06030 [Mizuhopecten yessoensis]
MGLSRLAICITVLAALSASLYVSGPNRILEMWSFNFSWRYNPTVVNFRPTLMGVTKALLGMAGVTAMAATLCNMPVSWFMSSEKATLKYLEKARVQTLDSQRNNITEALGLSSLLDDLNAHGVKLYGVVHQTLGVEEFKPFFKGQIFLDNEKTFYGPKERWMPLFGLFRVNVIQNIIRVYRKKIPGNMDGEGRLMGGVFVIGPGNQGILYQHQEQEFGDIADLEEVLKAIRNIKIPTSNL